MNKKKKVWVEDPYDPFYGNVKRGDKKRERHHNTIPAKFRYKEKKK